jgi:hypothetical protein
MVKEMPSGSLHSAPEILVVEQLLGGAPVEMTKVSDFQGE